MKTDTAAEMREVVVELLEEMMRSNEVEIDLISSIFFTATTDIHSIFPAAAARELDRRFTEDGHSSAYDN